MRAFTTTGRTAAALGCALGLIASAGIAAAEDSTSTTAISGITPPR